MGIKDIKNFFQSKLSNKDFLTQKHKKGKKVMRRF